MTSAVFNPQIFLFWKSAARLIFVNIVNTLTFWLQNSADEQSTAVWVADAGKPFCLAYFD